MHTAIPTVYLLHFSAPLDNAENRRALASHYIGWAVDLDSRLRQHRAGRGAAITRAAVERGIAFEVVATWPGDWLLERRLKALKATPRLCPICGKRHPGGRLHVAASWLQLELDFDDDFPPPPAHLLLPGPAEWLAEARAHRFYAEGAAAERTPLTELDTSDAIIPF
jgi:predicted GIY-YIG superfamily endonuclease